MSRDPFPSRARVSLAVLLRSVDAFIRVEANCTLLLLVATVVAIVWANSPQSATYALVWQTPIATGLDMWLAPHSMQSWINEVLMTTFFLVVGLEIRTELHDGVLSDRRVAILPLAAALGGILLPALVFVAFNSDPTLRRGWAIPTATDIAFAVGVLMLLGTRVPRTLRVLLLTLAIVDDIGAVVVIAFYYSDGFAPVGLLIAFGAVAIVLGFQRRGLGHPVWYLLPGGLLWFGLDRAGIQPTLAGVILGLLTPVQNRWVAGDRPASRIKDALHPWVAFGVMPLFALANAGVDLHGVTAVLPAILSLGIGIVLGLVLGKPLGIFLLAMLCVKSGIGTLPGEMRRRHLLVLGCLGGIGFTMSIFIANLAFAQAELLSFAKGAVLLASLMAAGLGLLLGRWLLRPVERV